MISVFHSQTFASNTTLPAVMSVNMQDMNPFNLGIPWATWDAVSTLMHHLPQLHEIALRFYNGILNIYDAVAGMTTLQLYAMIVLCWENSAVVWFLVEYSSALTAVACGDIELVEGR